jgi:hypothetical protein
MPYELKPGEKEGRARLKGISEYFVIDRPTPEVVTVTYWTRKGRVVYINNYFASEASLRRAVALFNKAGHGSLEAIDAAAVETFTTAVTPMRVRIYPYTPPVKPEPTPTPDKPKKAKGKGKEAAQAAPKPSEAVAANRKIAEANAALVKPKAPAKPKKGKGWQMVDTAYEEARMREEDAGLDPAYLAYLAKQEAEEIARENAALQEYYQAAKEETDLERLAELAEAAGMAHM